MQIKTACPNPLRGYCQVGLGSLTCQMNTTTAICLLAMCVVMMWTLLQENLQAQ